MPTVCHFSTLNCRLLDLNSMEQSENVYENKGSLRKTGDEAGIYMKTSNLVVDCYIPLKTHELVTTCPVESDIFTDNTSRSHHFSSRGVSARPASLPRVLSSTLG